MLDALTDREREVFTSCGGQGPRTGRSLPRLFVSEHTVKIHVARVLSKLDLRDRVQAVVFAYESGLVVREDD